MSTALTLPQKQIAWSYSTLNSYLTCPRQYHEVKVLKNYTDDNAYSGWGTRVHKYFETKLKNPTFQDAELDLLYNKIILQLQRVQGTLSTEVQLAITNGYKPAAWFGKDVWCRAIVDALWLNGNKAKAIDLKTGKRRPDTNQMLICSLLIFANHPEIDIVNSAFVWLQNGKMDVMKYKREDIPSLWQEVLPDVRRFENAHKTQQWTPKPSGLCKNNWCKVESCRFWDGIKTKEIVT